MIQVVLQLEETTNNLNILSAAPLLVTLAVVTAAYHEMLSKKIQADIKADTRIVTPTLAGIIKP